MLDTVIDEFFQARKEAWLKKNISASIDADTIKAKEAECESVFSFENWLPSAAKRAGQISISTHPCTFSHPSSRKNKNGYASSVIANSMQANDGYLRSGNIAVEADALGNAAALDVYKFLTLVMDDGNSLLIHIQQDSDLAVELLTIKSAPYQELKEGFLAMVESTSENITSSKIKQVYFPVAENYHQLSLLTASGIVFELRKRIDNLRFSDEIKEIRKCKNDNVFHEKGYKQLNNITTIGYGGTKPQNISVLNNQNGGKAHLLLCSPPLLKKRDIQFPNIDFFSQAITPFQCKNIFYSLHELYRKHKNNKDVRNERDKHFREIIDKIIATMWAIRAVEDTQFNPDSSQLNRTQRIWLCSEFTEHREEENDWLDTLVDQISQFIFTGYEKVLKKRAITFSDEEYKHINAQVENAKEALR